MASSYCRNGFVVVAISYRLSRQASHPAQIQDVARAVKWVYDNIEHFDGNRDQFFLSGHSAGGHLVSLLSTDERWLKEVGLDLSMIKGTVSLSGIYNLSEPLTPPDASACSFRTALFHRVYAKPTFGADQSKWQDASPIHYIEKSSKLPPILLINAQNDLGLQHGAVSYRETLQQCGHKVEHHTISYTNHGSVSRNEKTIAKIVPFLRNILTAK